MADMGYVWDEDKYALVQEKHRVSLSETVQACEDPRQIWQEDPQGHSERFMIVGQTEKGRLLWVIGSEDELPLVRLITAFEAEPKWREEYEREG